MGVESASYISELVDTNPLVSDAVGQGDDHLRLIKAVLKTQFSGLSGTTAIASSEAELNYNNITTLGTVEASKVVTTDGSSVTNFVDKVIQRPEIKDYSETKTALSAAATVDIDLEDGNVFTLTADQDTTFTFSNPSPTGKSCAFTLIWTQDSSDRTIAWPITVDWAGGSAPDVTSGAAKIDVYTFFTLDAGTIWYGFQPGADMG